MRALQGLFEKFTIARELITVQGSVIAPFIYTLF